MEESLFRKKSMERISSPEQLNDYLHVTSPAVWIIMAAIVLLLAGMLIWGSMASIDSFASGTAQVKDGSLRVIFDDRTLAESVQTGMVIEVGENAVTIRSVGVTESGDIFALGATTLADGSYPARVVLRRTQVLKLLLN